MGWGIDQATEQVGRAWGGDSPGTVSQSHLSIYLVCYIWIFDACVPGHEKFGGTAPKNENACT